jgi:hypothetical protein
VYEVRVRVTARDNPSESDVALARWTVAPFAQSALEIRPDHAIAWRAAPYLATITNEGNEQVAYQFNAADGSQQLRYRYKQAQQRGRGQAQYEVMVDPGAAASVDVAAIAPWHLFGRPRDHRFTLQVLPLRERRNSRERGETRDLLFSQRALIPGWVIPLLTALLALILLHGYGMAMMRYVPQNCWLCEPTATPTLPLPTAIPPSPVPAPPQPTRTSTATSTVTPTNTLTNTPLPSDTATSRPSNTATLTPSRTATSTPTLTPTITLTPTPAGVLACYTDGALRIEGYGPPRTAFLAYFGERAVGGGITDGQGRYRVELGDVIEAPGEYRISVRSRDRNEPIFIERLIYRRPGAAETIAAGNTTSYRCIVPSPTSLAVPTPAISPSTTSTP